VSATANGGNITITYGTAGAVGNGVAVAGSSQSTQTQWDFSPPSFSSAGTTLANGLNAGDVNDNPLITLYQYDGLGDLMCIEQHGGVTGTGCSSAPTNDATSPWRVRRFTYDTLGRLLTAANPESGTITYSYDADSNLVQKTSPAPNQTNPAVTQTISYCYDELHRVTGKGYGAQSCPLASPVVSYTYDSGANAKGG
jgi:YD repeat-containing protein